MLRTGLRIATVAALVGIGWMAVKAQTSEPQQSALASSQATNFIGTWALTMTEPDAFKGSQQTVSVWNKNGVLAASVQIGKFPPVEVTGIFDHPAALGCTLTEPDGEPVPTQDCRLAFAVTRLVTVGP